MAKTKAEIKAAKRAKGERERARWMVQTHPWMAPREYDLPAEVARIEARIAALGVNEETTISFDTILRTGEDAFLMAPNRLSPFRGEILELTTAQLRDWVLPTRVERVSERSWRIYRDNRPTGK